MIFQVLFEQRQHSKNTYYTNDILLKHIHIKQIENSKDLPFWYEKQNLILYF
jgi:hypothetical protein